MSLLEIEGLTARYGAADVLKGLTLSVEEGEIVALLGANGAGKSTTLRSISGLVPHTTGAIRLAGKSLIGMKTEAIVRLGISHVPEGRRVFPGLTVAENIVLGASNRSGVARSVIAQEVVDEFKKYVSIIILMRLLMGDQIFFETDRLLLRTWKKSDEDAYIKMNKDKEVMKYFPQTLSENDSCNHIDKILNHFQEYGYGLYALELK